MHRSLFLYRISKNNPNGTQKHRLFTVENQAVTWFFTFYTFDGWLNWPKVGHGQLFSSIIFYDNFLWIDSLHFSLLLVHPKVSSKTKNTYKSRFHSKQLYDSISETENALHWCENLIQTCHICLTRITEYKALFNSQYTIHTNHYLYYRLFTVLNFEISV